VDQRAKVIAVGADKVTATDETGASLYGAQPRTTGAVYLYTQATEFREATGHQMYYPAWATSYPLILSTHNDIDVLHSDASTFPQAPQHGAVATERAKIQPIGPRGETDHFGFSVAVDHNNLVAGAPGEGNKGLQAGAAYIFDTTFRNIQFAATTATVVEADPGKHSDHSKTNQAYRRYASISVNLLREGDVSNELKLQYTTSDITARGVTPYQAEICSNTPYPRRTGDICGDYVSSRGVVTFLKRENLAIIEIQITDDECLENTESFLLQLSNLGGDPLVGELYRMTISIDDNDAGKGKC